MRSLLSCSDVLIVEKGGAWERRELTDVTPRPIASGWQPTRNYSIRERKRVYRWLSTGNFRFARHTGVILVFRNLCDWKAQCYASQFR